MISSCKSRAAILRVPSLLINEWFLFGTFQLLDRMDVFPVLLFVAIESFRGVNWFSLGEQSWFLYIDKDSKLGIFKEAPPLNRVLSDGSKEWREGGKEARAIYRKKYVSLVLTESVCKRGVVTIYSQGGRTTMNYHRSKRQTNC